MGNDGAPSNITGLFEGEAGSAQNSAGITTRAFLLNLAVGFGLFAVELTIYFLLKSSNIGRRILYVHLTTRTSMFAHADRPCTVNPRHTSCRNAYGWKASP
jgi:hypothetical protein